MALMDKLQIPVGVYGIGDVIYIQFKFDDSTKSKPRPAIIIDYDETQTRVIVLKVTTKQVRTMFDYPVQNPEQANLKEGSVVRCNHILTLPNEFKCKHHGRLARQDELAIRLLYNQALQANALVDAT